MINAVCEYFPHLVVVGTFWHGVLYCPSKRAKILPGNGSIFWKVLLCSVFSVLVKYLFSGERPKEKKHAVKRFWREYGAEGQEADEQMKTGRTCRKTLVCDHIPCLEMQPKRDLIDLPLSPKDLKRKYFPKSGTPSSHSVFSGYLLCVSHSLRKFRAAFRLANILVIFSRVHYGHHYAYQALMGGAIGYLFGIFCK